MKNSKAWLIFGGFTLYFYGLLFTLMPLLKGTLTLNPTLYWFLTGYALFVPLFLFALGSARREGARGLRAQLAALQVRPFTPRDWRYALGGLLAVLALTGLIFGFWALLHRLLGIPMLNTTPWFMEMQPFTGADRWLLLVWAPMFFFNIVGEELLWRGYVQARLEGPGAWPLCAGLWLLFHLPFGRDLMILLVPVILIIPWVFHRTRNAAIGIFIHGLYNGPMFVAIALGLMHP